MPLNSLTWRLQRRAVALAIGLTLALHALDAAAAETMAAKDAERFVRGFVAQVGGLLTQASAGEATDDHRVRQVLTAGFDVKTMSKFVLDDHWGAASQAERNEFGALFQRFLLDTYVDQLGKLSGGRFDVVAARPRGSKGYQVRSTMSGAGGAPRFHVEWRLWHAEPGWRIVDVMVQGVSLLKTYRSQFTHLIGQNGGDVGGLLVALRKRVVADAR